MKIICTSYEKEKLIQLIDESEANCKKNCMFYDECCYDCELTLERNIEWIVEGGAEK